MADSVCVLSGQQCGACSYCTWKGSGAPLLDIPDAFIQCPEAARLTQVYGPDAHSTGVLKSPVLRPAGAFKRIKTTHLVKTPTGNTSVAEERLFRFLRLLRWMGTAPWANVDFNINSIILNRLTASHLHLIVGKQEFNDAPRAVLFKAISPKLNLQDSQNLVWITNRQNGKTSTIGRFIAALAISSPVGGMLATIYSTSLDRAVELKKSAMAYIHWMMSKGAHPEWKHLKLIMSNYTTFALQNGTGAAINTVIARPKSADSCRGDAPEAAFFDEIGACT